MATQIKVWEISGDRLTSVAEVAFADSHREDELENWIVQCPDVLGENLLIIARQLEISGVGRLDLLCMDSTGELVIVELKRGLTPREAIAQALDYASWLDDATEEEIAALAAQHLKRDLDEAFEEYFHVKPPDWVCENHRILLVAARLDTSAERIINYLAERYEVNINVAFFNYSKLSNGREILIRSMLVPDAVVGTAARHKRPSEADLMAIASERNTIPLVEICRRMKSTWGEEAQNTSGGSFRYWLVKPGGGYKMVFGINVSGKLANPPQGQLDVWVRTDGLAAGTGVSKKDVRERLSRLSKPFKTEFMDFIIRLKSTEEADQLVSE